MAINNEKEKGKNEGKKNTGFMDKKNGRKRAHCPVYWPKELKKQRNLEVILIYFVCVSPLFFFFQSEGLSVCLNTGSSSATGMVTERSFRNITACKILSLS